MKPNERVPLIITTQYTGVRTVYWGTRRQSLYPKSFIAFDRPSSHSTRTRLGFAFAQDWEGGPPWIRLGFAFAQDWEGGPPWIRLGFAFAQDWEGGPGGAALTSPPWGGDDGNRGGTFVCRKTLMDLGFSSRHTVFSRRGGRKKCLSIAIAGYPGGGGRYCNTRVCSPMWRNCWRKSIPCCRNELKAFIDQAECLSQWYATTPRTPEDSFCCAQSQTESHSEELHLYPQTHDQFPSPPICQIFSRMWARVYLSDFLRGKTPNTVLPPCRSRAAPGG